MEKDKINPEIPDEDQPNPRVWVDPHQKVWEEEAQRAWEMDNEIQIDPAVMSEKEKLRLEDFLKLDTGKMSLLEFKSKYRLIDCLTNEIKETLIAARYEPFKIYNKEIILNGKKEGRIIEDEGDEWVVFEPQNDEDDKALDELVYFRKKLDLLQESQRKRYIYFRRTEPKQALEEINAEIEGCWAAAFPLAVKRDNFIPIINKSKLRFYYNQYVEVMPKDKAEPYETFMKRFCTNANFKELPLIPKGKGSRGGNEFTKVNVWLHGMLTELKKIDDRKEKIVNFDTYSLNAFGKPFSKIRLPKNSDPQ